ncbi:MAG: methyltransferase, partial [Muribaculaceae bacterium]|nr:methyltransferase [Muribaculaceae bacterium]
MFDFKQFSIDDSGCAMKVGTDSVLLGAWTDTAEVNSAVDVGAGSGLLTLMTAQRTVRATITAIEMDPGAAASAAANITASPWADRCFTLCIDAAHFNPEEKVDLVICNPPYFT